MKLIKILRLLQIALIISALLPAPSAAHAQTSIDLAVHYIEGTPLKDEIAYQVKVYLSILGATGLPIKDLNLNALTITEDSQKIEAQSLRLVENEPISLVLVMDTSGSMVGAKIKDAKAAAAGFISRLQSGDQVALLTFDESIKIHTSFTSNPTEILDRIALIDAAPGSGTCLYDAAYRAIQTASTLPAGRRAVILFTDGVDETASGSRACSVHTVDDILSAATQGSTRTPLYTLGLGNRIDENILKRLAALSGGRYIYSPDTSQLETMFELLSEQLRFQYLLTYKSFAAPGAHTLAVNAAYLGAQDSDTRNFLLPALPARLTFLTPLEGETVENNLKITVALSNQSETIERVDFQINGALIGSDDTTPYELEFDLSHNSENNLTITAIAYGANNTELTRHSVNVIHKIEEPAPLPPTAAPEPEPLPEPAASPLIMLGMVLAGLGLLIIALLGILLFRQKRQEPASPKKETPPQSSPSPARSVEDAEGTLSSFEVGAEALGALTVEASDDPSMIGLRFEILTPLTSLGRSASNDIAFPRDNPVSRRHAEIFEDNQKLWLREAGTMDDSGAYTPPKYGTFVNDIPLGSHPVELKNGDEIRLGKRLRLRFQTRKTSQAEEAKTFDDLTLEDDVDRTVDQT